MFWSTDIIIRVIIYYHSVPGNTTTDSATDGFFFLAILLCFTSNHKHIWGDLAPDYNQKPLVYILTASCFKCQNKVKSRAILFLNSGSSPVHPFHWHHFCFIYEQGGLLKREEILTLVLKEKNLHSIEGKGLSETVRDRVLLLLKNLGHLKGIRQTKWNTHSTKCACGKLLLWRISIRENILFKRKL